MRAIRFLLASVILFTVTAGVGCYSQCVAAQPAVQDAAKAKPEDSHNANTALASATSITHHVIQVRGKPLKYTATAGYLPLKDEQGKLEAELFFTAYTKEEVDDTSRRPVAFAFNGGPGASSLWLHLGGLGPKRAPLARNGTALPQTDQLVDNGDTWLDFTDLVFVDPVGTGYSRAAPGVDAKQFFDVERDVRTAASFIRLYLTHYNRWLSPKFLVGESYGTTRAAALAQHLQSTDGINLRGVVLLSSAIDFQTFSFAPGNDLAYALAVPSYTAAAWYHKRLSPRLQADLNTTLAEIERWSLAEYLPALAQGHGLPEARRAEIAARLAEYTGLSPQYIDQSDLRVSNRRFTKELLRGNQQKIGLLDSRVTGEDLAPWTSYPEGDPAMALVTGPLVATLNHYLRNDLKFSTDLPYQFLSASANHSWNWGSAASGFVNVVPKLKEALTANSQLRLFMGAGYFDLTTPYFSQVCSREHLGLNRSLWQHVIYRSYRSGHQIYNSDDAMRQLRQDAAKFFSNESESQ